MSTETPPPEAGAAARRAATISVAAPTIMVLLLFLLPRTNGPANHTDNSWYFWLTVMVCIVAIAASGWALTHNAKGDRGIAARAIIGVLASGLVGLLAFFLASIQGMHT